MSNRIFTQIILTIMSAVALVCVAQVEAWAAVQPTLLSRGTDGGDGNNATRKAAISDDGRFTVFESSASNLNTGVTDTNNVPDIFLYDARTGVLRCISLGDATHTANGASVDPIISADGRYVVFTSNATNLQSTTPDSNDNLDIFRYDTQTGQIELVSVNFAGTDSGNAPSGSVNNQDQVRYAISDNGRFVAFISLATNLNLVTDANGKNDIYLRDVQNHFTYLVSINGNGTAAGNDVSFDPSISADGHLIAYTSPAGNLVGNDTNNDQDVFIFNTQTQITTCASISVITGNTGTFPSFTPVISKNGARVLYFTSTYDITHVTIPFSNMFQNLVVYDLGLRENFLVSVNAAGNQSGNDVTGSGDGTTSGASISADGRYVVFDSRATNLTVQPTPPAVYQIYRRDLSTGTTEVVSKVFNSTQGGTHNSLLNGRAASVSRDGRFVVFESDDFNQAGDFPTLGMRQVYVRDLTTGVTTGLALNLAATALGNNSSASVKVSGNGKAVAFFSFATDLAPNNTHSQANVYRASVPTPQSAVADFDGDGLTDFAVFRPGSAAWFVLNNPQTSASYRLYGTATDRIVPGDYNSDGRTDYAVFRPANGTWYINDSLSFGDRVVQFGQNGDQPVPQDYDGDGRVDLAVYRNGIWYVMASLSGQVSSYSFGLASDLPVPSDYDGDSKADIAVFRPADGNWYIRQSTNGALRTVHFGQSGDKPVAADYDGDGRTDVAIFRDGVWWIFSSRFNSTLVQQWGTAGDIPTPGSFDSDGRADVAVFRPSDGNWYVLRSASGNQMTVHFGQSGDMPVPAPFIP